MYHPSFNIGIEEEYQLIDPATYELVGYVSQSMARDRIEIQARHPDVKIAEPGQSPVVEAGTPVCVDVAEARDKLLHVRRAMLELAHAQGLRLAAAGTHPFSSWERTSSPAPRYQAMVDDAQMIARRMLAFGMRVHIGVEDRELAIDVMNTMSYVLPHILCLSTSSPFWAGRNTGLKSYRKVLLDALPRTGIPGRFTSYAEYRSFVDMLVRTNCIPDAGRIWYDLLPHHRFPTLVVRICDVVPDYRDALAITALIQATVAWMVDLRARNMSFRIYDRTLINENRWRAVRYGLDGQLIDFGTEEAKPARDLLRELVALVEPQAVKLNAMDDLGHVYTILERGASADRQLAVWRESGENLTAVVEHLIRETETIP